MKPSAILAGVASLALAFMLVSWISGARRPQPAGTVEAEAEKDPSKDEIRKNPFEKPIGDSAPKIEVAETTHRFGVMPFGVKGGWSHDFVVKNVGNDVLRLAKGPSTCQCTMSDLESLEVAPGESTIIKLTWDPTGVSDHFYKSATIWTNDPALWEKTDSSHPGDGAIVFTVEGEVHYPVAAEPDTISLGSISESEPTEIVTHIFSRVVDQLELSLDREQTSPHIDSVTLTPVPPKEFPDEKIKCGYEMKALLKPTMALGPIEEQIVLNAGEQGTVKIQVTGLRRGPFVFAGQGWFPSNARFSLGRFLASEGTSRKLTVYSPKREEPPEITVVKKVPDWLEVEIGPVEQIEGDEERERLTITFRVPANRPPERVVYSQKSVVHFRTNFPSMPEFKIYLVYESQ